MPQHLISHRPRFTGPWPLAPGPFQMNFFILSLIKAGSSRLYC